MQDAVCAHMILALLMEKNIIYILMMIIYYYISGCGSQVLRGVACSPKHRLKKLALWIRST